MINGRSGGTPFQGFTFSYVTPRALPWATLGTPRWGYSQSIDVFQVPLLRLRERHLDILLRRFGRESPMLLRDRDQHLVHILRHPLGVAANVKIGALLQPLPQFRAVL